MNDLQQAEPTPESGSSLYGPEYYASHCGPITYDRSQPHWLEFFGVIADELIRAFRPRTVFDAGCAHGFLVESFWDRGVKASGRDISEFAVSQVRPDVRSYCTAGDLTEPIEGWYDLVTSIEVLEHMSEADGAHAIANMVAVTDRIVFSSSPDDFTESTHVNVRPPLYWLQAFAAHNFAPVIDVALPSITPYALAFERRDAEPSAEYLIACANLVRARIKLNRNFHDMGALRAKVAAAEAAQVQRQTEHDEQLAAVQRRYDNAVLERSTLLAEYDALSATHQALAGAHEQLTIEHSLLRTGQTQLLTQYDALLATSKADRDQLNDRDHSIATMQAALSDARIEQQRLRDAHDAIANSTIWSATRGVRRMASGASGTTQFIRRAVRVTYWTVSGQLPARLAARRSRGVPALPALRSEPEEFVDSAYYLSTHADVAAAGLDPERHYREYGRAEGRFPSAAAESRAASFVLADLCEPQRDEDGPKTHDADFLVSVLTPTYNTEPRYLQELLQTLRNQTYSNWEWVVVDDGSTKPETVAVLRKLAAIEPRMRLTVNATNQNISAASNAALSAVRGTHVALVDHDDLVSRGAFQAIYDAWQTAPGTHLFFTDECKLRPNGSLAEFWAKPDWSPAYLENTMCLGHLSVYEVRFLRALGGFRSKYDGTQDFDLALRASLTRPHVVHVPVFAYLWRIIPGSAATDLSEKHYAIERQRDAVMDYARQRNPAATVIPGWGAGYWRIVYPLPSPAPLLSYVIPTGGGSRVVRGARVDLVLNCIRSFETAAFYPNREYVVVHNGNLSAQQVSALEAVEGVRLVHYAQPTFNFSEKLNLGVASAKGSILCLLNDDVQAITRQGGEQLVSYLLASPEVGAIGPMCLHEDGTIQQNGVVLLGQVGPAHAGDRRPRDFGGHQVMMRCRREAFCIGGAILFVDAALYRQVGGFSEDLPLNYNDVDFGLKLRELGRTCVVDPGIEVFHFEGATKVGTSTVEQERFFLRHPGITDPYFSPWFDQSDPNYRLQLKKPSPGLSFGPWLDRHIASRAALLVPEGRFKLSVCVSVYNQPKRLLEEMFSSVVMQTYANKELVILDNGSSNAETMAWLTGVWNGGLATFVRVDENLGISGGNLKLLEAMTGDFFVAMDADDFLSVDALQMLAYAIEANPGKPIFYSDEYKSDMNSARFSPFFKPDFDPILLMNCCYPAHLMAMDAAYLRRIGAYTDARATWCHDYDTLTRSMAIGVEPIHVREAIYAWRINPGSTASVETFGKPETTDSQRFVLQRLLEAKQLADTLTIEPNRIESSRGMWRLSARASVSGITVIDSRDVWGVDGMGVAGLAIVAAKPGTEWVAILGSPKDHRVLVELSSIALFDSRVNVVSGVLLTPDRTVLWSGGLFHPESGVFDPYRGQAFNLGGYHGQLWCQRCIDVAAPIDILVKASALTRVAQHPGMASSADLVVMLGLDALQRDEFVTVTPHVQTPMPALDRLVLPTGASSLLDDVPALSRKSRWYDPLMEAKRPYKMANLQ
jgi:glycosyltransferase involved in cell wall biosynthesis/SAM-dependent methyltransferase